MIEMSYRQILQNGVWTQNTGLVALLGLCPLLATSNSWSTVSAWGYDDPGIANV